MSLEPPRLVLVVIKFERLCFLVVYLIASFKGID